MQGKKEKKIVLVSDFDGIITSNGKVSEYTLSGITDFQVKGGLFGICSGRSIAGLFEIEKQYNLSCDFLMLYRAPRVGQRKKIMIYPDLCRCCVKDVIS
jgi:hypothetical protein